jgi:hypothetical protein
MRATVLAIVVTCAGLMACEQQTEQTEAQCELQARNTAANAASDASVDIHELVGLCMKARGYTVKTDPRCFNQNDRLPVNLLDASCYERSAP